MIGYVEGIQSRG